MSELRFDAIKMQAALVGRSNPHPQFSASTAANLISTDRVDPQIPLKDYEYINYARRNTCLPYLWQDAYERNRTEQSFKTAVLENETLKAVFLLEYGGRLWSLFHKPTQRELLYVNPIFQPGNLAIRGAWFSGGIEWNFGLRGHTPFTCDPVFVATSRLDDGTPVLRMYEYERVTCLPFQLDFYLPDKSELLFVRVTIRNPDSRTVPIYWWSNIAVPETQDCRVLVPADSLYSFAYGSGKLVKLAHPYLDNTDRSRPTNLLRSSDSFYVIPTGRQPWIASVDKSGNGLFQASTKELRGRKLFAWGQSSGGKNWQQFLSLPNQSYIEIQAGLDRTQSTCQPLHGFDRREWIETYGLITCDPEIVHGDRKSVV